MDPNLAHFTTSGSRASFSDRASPSSIDTDAQALEHIAQLLNSTSQPVSLSLQSDGVSERSFRVYDGWCLLVSIDGVDFDYQFTRDDLRTVFQRYGRIIDVDTLSSQFPFGRVWFADQRDAEAAIRDLDNKILNGIHGRLRVIWDPYSIQKMQHQASELSPVGDSHLLSPSSAAGVIPRSGLPPTPGSQAQVRKYTCRFDIGVENEKEFQIARRIIGSKGCNMKKIVDVSGAKLRLRGRGSGYLEGPNKEESPEPLHLCVSCTTQDGYNAAVRAVTEILEGIYSDYRKFCLVKKKGREFGPDPSTLRVVIRETPLVGGSITPSELVAKESYQSSPEPLPATGATATPLQRPFDSGYWKVPN